MTSKSQNKQRSSASGRRYRRTNLRSALLTIASILIVGIVAFFAFRFFSHTNSGTNGNTNGGSTVANGSPTPPAIKSGQPVLPASFYTTLKSQIAQGLHLSVAQITAQLQAPFNPQSGVPAVGIADIATKQGITADQLHTIEVNAYRAAYNAMVQAGVITQQLADEDVQYYSQTSPSHLNDEVTLAFGGNVRGNSPGGGNGSSSQSVPQ